MKFNFSRSLDFSPQFNLGSEDLEIVKSSKILGLMINDQLKWNTHVEYICNRARQRTWALRRLLLLKLDYEIIIDFYQKEVRSILEYGAVVYHSGLTKRQSGAIEAVQRHFFQVVSHALGLKMSYNEACILYCSEKFEFYCLDICKRFIHRTKNNPKHKDMFKTISTNYNTRNGNNIRQFRPRTTRFARSPLVYLTNLAKKTSKISVSS